MKMIAAILAVVLSAACGACTTTPGDKGVRSGKVGDQRLAVYAPFRRLTYRNACGSEGPLTVCVDRIIVSGSAALVDVRIKNASPEKYVLSTSQGASVMMADRSGRTLAWDGGNSTECPGLKEKTVSFRMEGLFPGEPYAVMVNSIRKAGDNANYGMSVVALLGE